MIIPSVPLGYHLSCLGALCKKVNLLKKRTFSFRLLRLLPFFKVCVNFGTLQFLPSSPLSQAGGLNRLQDRSRSAALQSRIGGRQRPLVGQQESISNEYWSNLSNYISGRQCHLMDKQRNILQCFPLLYIMLRNNHSLKIRM